MSASARRGLPALLAALVLLAWGCAGTPPRVAAPPAPPVSPAPPPAPSAARFVRVLLAESRGPVTLAGSPVRFWNAQGALVAEESGSVVLSAAATGIRIGEGRTVGAAVDAAGSPEVRLGEHRVRGRIRIAARRGTLLLVAAVPLEEYVTSVLSRETPPSFHPEALAAVAVAVRTYARGALAKPRDPLYDVASDVKDQVFEAGNGDAEPFAAAAAATRGAVLTAGGAIALTVYHATCGGSTEDAAGAWGRDVPYLRSVSCGGNCRRSPGWRWEYLLSGREGRRIARALGVRTAGDLGIAITARTATGRARRILLSAGGVSREMSAELFRKEAGYARVKSLKMEIRPKGGGWLIRGEGYGHGVGLCQWGADGMARAGAGHRDILARYYPGTALSGGDD